MAHGVRGKRRGNTVDVSDLVEAAIELLRLGDLLLPLIDHRQGVLHRGQRLQIAGAVVDGDTLRDCRPRHSKGDGAKYCVYTLTHSSSFPDRCRPTLLVKKRQPDRKSVV